MSKKFIFTIIAFAVVSVCFFLFSSKQPSNNRDWQEEFAIMPQTSVQNGVVEIKDVRDWRYESNGPYSKEYIVRNYSVQDLERVWFLVEPFSGWDGVAHTYFVFDFKNQQPISFSVEARREKGENFNTFTGLFKKFDLIYLWGTEHDFTVNRVITYKNDVYMYPLQISNESGKKLFLELSNQTAELYTQPRFYNTLTSNCTNTLADFANNVKPGAVPFHYARVMPGYSEELLYDLGYFGTDKSLAELKEKYHINPYVEKHYKEASFSALLRQELSK